MRCGSYVVTCFIGLKLFILVVLISGSVSSQELDTAAVLIPANANWRYHASAKVPQHGWHKPEFDDTGWKSGMAGFGYGDDDDRTDLSTMQG